jgi:Protein of unknown function (DUF3575)
MALLRLFFLIFILLFFGVMVNAQPQRNDINIRTNILSWLEPNAGGPVLGLEYFISNKFSIGVDAGLIFYNLVKIEDNDLGDPWGYRVKPEIRYYLYKKDEPDATRLFFGLEGLYIKTTTINFNDLPVTDNMGNIVYYYLGGFNEIKKVTGLNTKAGVQFPGFIFKKMLLELYAGVGTRDKRYSYTNLPAGAVIERRAQSEFLLNTDIDGSYPSLTAGFKLVFKIN